MLLSLWLLACSGGSVVQTADAAKQKGGETAKEIADREAEKVVANDPRYKAQLEDTTIRIEPAKKDIVTLSSEKTTTISAGGIHDMQNDAAVVLQNPTDALADFPRAQRNEVDWVKAMNDGLIHPRAEKGGEGSMQILDLDILMKDTAGMPWVRFPHLAHTKWLDCSNCHPSLFEPVDNGNPVNMTKVLRGEYCGVCHDKVAFSVLTCNRCHNTPQ